MFYYVYILESLKDGNIYVGRTINLKKRLVEHNRGLNFSTKPYSPYKIIHYEAYIDEEDAKRRERYLKSSTGSKMFKKMLREYFHKNKISKNKSKNY